MSTKFYRGDGYSVKTETYYRITELEDPRGPLVMTSYWDGSGWFESAWSRDGWDNGDGFTVGRVQVSRSEVPENTLKALEGEGR